MADEGQGNDVHVQKKPFNKKRWRELKYSNKAKVERWDEKRRKSVLRRYHKELKKEGLTHKSTESSTVFKSNRPVSAVKEAKLKYERIQQEKLMQKEEQDKIKKEKDEAIKRYKEKKAEKFRKLSLKTRKGQPVMKGRMELLLEKIERQYSQHSQP